MLKFCPYVCYVRNFYEVVIVATFSNKIIWNLVFENLSEYQPLSQIEVYLTFQFSYIRYLMLPPGIRYFDYLSTGGIEDYCLREV